MLITRRRRRMSAESASAVYLAFTTQPGTSGASPYTLSPQPVVAAKKSKGTTDTAKAGTVTISLVVLTGAASLSGTTTKALSSGVADFAANGLTVTATSDATWYLVASLSGLTSATSVTGTTTVPTTVNRADNYNRANSSSAIGTPSDGGSAAVTRVGVVGINTNQAYAVTVNNSTGAGAAMAAQFQIAAATYTCSANGTLVVTIPTRSFGGVMFRYVDDNNYWLYLTLGNALYLLKIDTGVATRVQDGVTSKQGTLADGMQLKVVMTSSGFELRTIVSGVEQSEYTSTDTHGSTGVEHGPCFCDTTTRLDDFGWTGA